MASSSSMKLSDGGQSRARQDNKRVVVRAFAKYVESNSEVLSERFPVPFDQLPEATAIDPDTYDDFASHLMDHGPPSAVAVISYLRTAIHISATRFKATGSPEAKLFFTCQNKKTGTEASDWLRTLQHNITRTKFQEALEKGENQDHSAVPAAPDDIMLMSQGYARSGTAQAAEARAVVVGLYQAGGRPQEMPCFTLSRIRWCKIHMGAVVSIPMSKVTKVKCTVLTAGANRHLDFILCLVDMWALQAPPVYEADEVDWVFQNLQTSNTPSVSITNYLRNLEPGVNQKWSEFVQPNLTPGMSAYSLRHGVAERLMKYMPADHVIPKTGHDMTHVSALYEYVPSKVTDSIPAQIVLAGYPPLVQPWGYGGEGPQPASLDSLATYSVDMTKVETFIDLLINIDSASHPDLQQDGRLRPIVRAGVAAQIMYYEERTEANEMHNLLVKMHESFSKAGLGPLNVAHDALVEYGSAIRVDFNKANLHLTAPTLTSDGTATADRKSVV